MGETLRVEKVMEKKIKNQDSPTKLKVHKSKVKNGEGPLLDPSTHKKLMRLFSHNTRVNLCLPIIKLHRLEAQDLKECQGISKECANFLSMQLNKLKRNAKKRLRRKLNKIAKDNANLQQSCVKPVVSTSENLANGGDQNLSKCDGGVAGPSKRIHTETKCAGKKDALPSKKLKTDFKKKKIKKEKHLSNGSNVGSQECGDSVKKARRWEEQYLPTLAGPRAPLPPAPLLNLNLPRHAPPMRPVDLSKPSLPFGTGSAPLPPLKPIHSAFLPNPLLAQRGLDHSLSAPPPLHMHVGNGTTLPNMVHHPHNVANMPDPYHRMPVSSPMVPFHGNLVNPSVRISNPAVLPAAPPMVPFSAAAPLALQPKLMSAPPPLIPQAGTFSSGVPSLDEGSSASSHSHPVVCLPNIFHHSGVTTTHSHLSSAQQCIYSQATFTSPVSKYNEASSSQSQTVCASSEKIARNSKLSTGLYHLLAENAANAVTAGSLKNPVACNSNTAKSSSSTCSVTSVSSSSSPVKPSSRQVTSQPSAAVSVPRVSSSEVALDEVSNSQMPLVLLPFSTSSYPNTSFHSSEEVENPSMRTSKISPNTSVSQLYLLLKPKSSAKSTNVPSSVLSSSSKNTSINNLSTMNGQSSAVNPHEQAGDASLKVSSPSFKKPSIQTVGPSVSSYPASGTSVITSVNSNKGQGHCTVSSSAGTSVTEVVVKSSLVVVPSTSAPVISTPSTSSHVISTPSTCTSSHVISTPSTCTSSHVISTPSTCTSSHVISTLSTCTSSHVISTPSTCTSSHVISTPSTCTSSPLVSTPTISTVISTPRTSSPLVSTPSISTVISTPRTASPSASPVVSSKPSPLQKKKPKSLLGFQTPSEMEAFAIEWIKKNYEMSEGNDIEQYKVQGHFQSDLYDKGRKQNQQLPMLNCMKFG